MKRLVIAISGPPGSGTTTLGKRIAKRLKLRFFSPGLYFKKLSRHGREGKVALELLKTRYGTSRKLHRHIDNLQIKRAKTGNIVVEGTLSVHFLRKLSHYKIWLDVPLKVRAQRTAHREGIPYLQALKEIKERQTIERKEWKKIYGFDYFDQKKQADFVLNTAKLPINKSIEKILDFIKRKGFNSN